jgi:hypothetical protein
MAQIIKFGTLTGLRSSEILQSVELINSGSKEILQEYYDTQNMSCATGNLSSLYGLQR